MRHLPEGTENENLLVGLDTSDDGGVFKLTDDLAIVQSIDYFTPICDDPYMFGQIAAANALSDIYAMGGKPVTALNIVGYPIKKMPPETLAEILRGGADKIQESGAVLAGGHSIDDQEPKYGLSVTGTVHPDAIFKNVGAKPGDKLVLTKPLGAGIITTAIKFGKASEQEQKDVMTAMATLNKTGAEVLADFHPHAVTDVTGFGLTGHGFEMANGSHVTLHISYKDVPVIDGTLTHARNKVIPGGGRENRDYLLEHVEHAPHIELADQLILSDSITSGGLLISLPADEADAYVDAYNQAQDTFKAAVIGHVTDFEGHAIKIK